jgi:hypothetical protein
MALLRTVKFRWVRGGFDESEAETVFFGAAKPVVLLPENSTEALLRVIDDQDRIWVTLGLNMDDLDQIIEQLQTTRDALDVYLEGSAKALLKKYSAEVPHGA